MTSTKHLVDRISTLSDAARHGIVADALADLEALKVCVGKKMAPPKWSRRWQAAPRCLKVSR